MLLSIGRRPHEPDLVDLLSDCHDRIRSFLDLAHRVATTPGLAAADIRTAGHQIYRYFTEAFPLHVADEEHSILPRLRGRDEGLDAALARMEDDHREHADLVERLVALCDLTMRDPRQLAALDETACALSLALEAHLSLEELVIFPALDDLSQIELAAIRAEMRGRRR